MLVVFLLSVYRIKCFGEIYEQLLPRDFLHVFL